MARRRGPIAATKRTERPIADVILGSLAELPLASDLADEIEMSWAALGAVGRQRFAAGHPDHASMLADTQRLVDSVRKRAGRSDFRACLLGDMARTDDSGVNFADEFAADLAALVRRDPRYLGSDLVVGAMVLWKLQVIRGMQLARATARAKRSVVAERARTYLRHLAAAAGAIARVTGRGRQEFIDPIVLLADHEHHVGLVRDVVEMIKCGKSNDEIANEIETANDIAIAGKVMRFASATKLSLASIAAIRERPRPVMQHAEQLTMDLYRPSFQVDELRRLLSDAREALDPQPPDWPGPRRARRSKRLAPTEP